ncbi:hypothetical protein ACIPLR_12295 [Herbaspirillum huttiense]|uniref:hypothetical protein n=1 Tax=Herbaspirillum huttiense TaxID=863372 RepID=UPI0037F8EB1C
MIAAIPAEDRSTIIRQSIPEPDRDRAQALKTSRIEAAHHYSNVLPRRFSVQLRVKINGAPLVCLSCGAKTNEDGDLPCDH